MRGAARVGTGVCHSPGVLMVDSLGTRLASTAPRPLACAVAPSGGPPPQTPPPLPRAPSSSDVCHFEFLTILSFRVVLPSNWSSVRSLLLHSLMPAIMSINSSSTFEVLSCASSAALEDEQRWVMWLVGLVRALARHRAQHLLADTSAPFLFVARAAQGPSMAQRVCGRLRDCW